MSDLFKHKRHNRIRKGFPGALEPQLIFNYYLRSRPSDGHESVDENDGARLVGMVEFYGALTLFSIDITQSHIKIFPFGCVLCKL